MLSAPGDAIAHAASDALKTAFCEEFGLTSCEITTGSDDEVYIFENLGFRVSALVHDCSSARMLECTNARVLERASVRVYECASVCEYECVHVWACR